MGSIEIEKRLIGDTLRPGEGMRVNSLPSRLLEHLEESQIRHELRGFPTSAVDAVLRLQTAPSDAALEEAVLQLLAFYLPRGANRDLSHRNPASRLREDLGVDSLTFAEAAYKMEELFAVRIENAELTKIQTLGELTAFAREKLLGPPATPAPAP